MSFLEKKEAFSAEYANILIDYFLKYEWQKCIHIADYSSQFSSKRAKFELYNSNNGVIEPHWIINANGKSMKLFPKETAIFSQKIKDFHQECQKDVSTRWNIWEFTLYSSGEYESSFIWDNQAYIDDLIGTNEEYQDSISEEFAHQFSGLSQDKNFTKSIVITDIANNEVKMETFFYENQTLVHQTPMFVDESWIGMILQMQENTKNPALGTSAIIWNRMIMDIPWSETDRKGIFDVKRDVKFEWREENA